MGRRLWKSGCGAEKLQRIRRAGNNGKKGLQDRGTCVASLDPAMFCNMRVPPHAVLLRDYECAGMYNERVKVHIQVAKPVLEESHINNSKYIRTMSEDMHIAQPTDARSSFHVSAP